MKPSELPKAKKSRSKFIRIRLSPPVQLALLRIRKTYLLPNDPTPEDELVVLILGTALVQWRKLHSGFWADLRYALDEGFDHHQFQMGKVQLLWEHIERRLS